MTQRKPPAMKVAKSQPKDATNVFIEALKDGATPVPPDYQLEAQGQAKRTNKNMGSLEEFNSIMAMIKRKLKHKGITSMDDI